MPRGGRHTGQAGRKGAAVLRDVFPFALRMRTALAQCGQLALCLQGQVAAEDKAPDSPHQTSTAVSAVDRLCQEILLLAAAEACPHLAVQSEELGDCPPEILALFAPGPHRYALILDPLDGTDEYLHGGARYAHMLGLLDQETGRMACGAIYFPARGRLYLGIRGAGAYLAEGLGGALRRAEAAPAPHTVANIKRLTPEDRATLASLGYEIIPAERSSAAHEFTRLVDGVLGAVVMRHFHGYDTAIASVIVEELGGQALLAGGLLAHYEAAMPRMPLVVLATNPHNATEIARAL